MATSYPPIREPQSQSNLQGLEDILECQYGLLTELRAREVLTDRQIAIIKAERTPFDQNDKLIELVRLLLDDRKKYMEFVASLAATGQGHIAKQITGIKSGISPSDDDRPLNIDERNMLKQKSAILVDLMDISTGLLEELLAANVITLYHRSSIRARAGEYEQKDELLEIFRRRSFAQYKQFLKCLGKTGQEHITRLLDYHTVVQAVDVSVDEELEMTMMQQFFRLSPESQRRFREWVSKRIPGATELIGFKDHHSIRFYFLCYSLQELQALRDLAESGQLKQVIEELFNSLLSGTSFVPVRLQLVFLVEYDKSENFFIKSNSASAIEEFKPSLNPQPVRSPGRLYANKKPYLEMVEQPCKKGYRQRSDAKKNHPFGAGAVEGFKRPLNPQPARSPGGQHANKRPYLEMVEQPREKGFRFRYECEGGRAGSLMGQHSDAEKRTFPSVQIKNLGNSSAMIVVSCVSKDRPYYPHPHHLVGPECKAGVYTVRLSSGQDVCQLQNIGIQCCKKKDVERNLELRQKNRVDPFGTGYNKNVELNAVRLCFQAFLPDPETKKFSMIITPIVSDPILDKKAVHDLVICRLSRPSGSAAGNQELIILCEKIQKDDIEVVFFEMAQDGSLLWEGLGQFLPEDVHKQVAIIVKTPQYRDITIINPVEVFVQLRKKSDPSCVSEPKTFLYTRRDIDPDGIYTKRMKLNRENSNDFLSDLSTFAARQPPTFFTSPIPVQPLPLSVSGQFYHSGVGAQAMLINRPTMPFNDLGDMLRRKTAVKTEKPDVEPVRTRQPPSAAAGSPSDLRKFATINSFRQNERAIGLPTDQTDALLPAISLEDLEQTTGSNPEYLPYNYTDDLLSQLGKTTSSQQPAIKTSMGQHFTSRSDVSDMLPDSVANFNLISPSDMFSGDFSGVPVCEGDQLVAHQVSQEAYLKDLSDMLGLDMDALTSAVNVGEFMPTESVSDQTATSPDFIGSPDWQA